MSQTFTATTCSRRALHCRVASSGQDNAACASFVAGFAPALVCCHVDRLLIPVHG